MLKKIRKIIVPVVVIPLVLALLIVSLPFILLALFISEKRFKARLKKFRKKKAGNFYLVCSRRSGWFEFIQNNVKPVLPSTVNIVWVRRDRNLTDNLSLILFRTPGAYGASKPLLVGISKDEIKVESLHEAFIDLKTHRSKDETTRKRVRQILESKLKNI